MSKLMYILSIFMITFSFNAYAQGELDCTDEQVFDQELAICVDIPNENAEEAPAEEAPEEAPMEEAE